MEIHWKKGQLDSRIDIALDVANNTNTLSKMIEKLENQKEFTSRKDVLTDLMKEMLQVTVRFWSNDTVKSGWREEAGKRLFRAYRKD